MQVNTVGAEAPAGNETWRWWEGRRLLYTLWLAVAGTVAWALYLIEISVIGPTIPNFNFHLSLSITLSQAMGWAVAMAIANVLYLLGPISETLIKPTDAKAFRRRMWALGLGLSVIVPFAFPAINLIRLLAIAGL